MRVLVFAILGYVLTTAPAGAHEASQVEALLQASSPPAGVAFEIVGGDAQTLHRALVRVQAYTRRLRQRYPDLPVVIVTHGLEQFSLRKGVAEDHPDLLQQVQRLVAQEQIPLQVCGALANMTGVTTDAFIDSVEVVADAPVQLEEYRYRGYTVIEMQTK